MSIFSHLKCQFVSYQADAVLGAYSFSYLEERSPIVYRTDNVREKALFCTEYTEMHLGYRKRSTSVMFLGLVALDF